eukprot:scaffold119326_cov26-Tisochrysis_lutea.AAC.1
MPHAAGRRAFVSSPSGKDSSGTGAASQLPTGESSAASLALAPPAAATAAWLRATLESRDCRAFRRLSRLDITSSCSV